MTKVIELKSAPSLPKIFARAVATSRSHNGKGGLPDLQVVRRGVEVDPSALADYNHVCGFGLRDELPATYLHNLVFPLQVTLFADRSYPYPLMGSVHLDNTLTVHRPIRLGEPLDLSTWATNARPHKSGVQVDVVSQAHVGDELVWEGLATYLYRGQKIALSADRGEDTNGRGPREVSEERSGGELRGVPMRPGAEGRGATNRGEVPVRLEDSEAPDGAGMIWRLSGDLGRRFAAVSGDVNPIHMRSITAKAMGFPSTIAHGMWSQAAMLASVENRLPDAYVATMSFRKPVLIPGTVRHVARQTGETWDLALRNNRKGTLLVRGEVSPIS